MKNNIYKILHFISLICLLILWESMMFFPEYMNTISFKMLLSLSIIFVGLYSFFRKKYFPQQKYERKEKIFCSILIILLFIRILFL